MTDFSETRLEAGERHPCDRCHRTYEIGVRGKPSSSCVVAKKTYLRRKVKEVPAEASTLSGRGRSTVK